MLQSAPHCSQAADYFDNRDCLNTLVHRAAAWLFESMDSDQSTYKIDESRAKVEFLQLALWRTSCGWSMIVLLFTSYVVQLFQLPPYCH